LQSIVQAADEAPTVQDALRAALARICETLHWQAGRLQFSGDAGDLSLRTFWHLNDPDHLTSFRALAEERRNATDVPEALREGTPLWRRLPVRDTARPNESETRGLYAFPIRLGGRLFAVMEFFAATPDEPPQTLLETLAFVSAQLGVILSRKPAENELRRSEREYRALFESAHDVVLIVDPESGLVLDANQRCADVYGYTRAQLLGSKLDDVWPQADHGRLRAAAQAHAGIFEARHRRRDGTEIIVEVSAGPVQFHGRPAVWMSNRDVTERKHTLDALSASEERYRLLFDASPQPMWVYDLETLYFLAVNQAALDRYGYARDEFARMTIAEIRPAEDQALLAAPLAVPPKARRRFAGQQNADEPLAAPQEERRDHRRGDHFARDRLCRTQGASGGGERRDRAAARAAEALARGLLRCAHRTAQSRALHGAAGSGAGPRQGPFCRRFRGALPRPRSLQGRQRFDGPPRGRSAARRHRP